MSRPADEPTPGGFGQPEGLAERLAYWANQFRRDKSYPWVGTGVIDDLVLASKMLGAEDFDKLYPLFEDPKPEPPKVEPPKVEPALEYDL